MMILRIPNRSVVPADFIGRQGVCQNLGCLAPLEPPYQSARLCLPTGTLETILCSTCMPRPEADAYPGMWLQVVAAAPVLSPPDRPGTAPGQLLASGIVVLPPPADRRRGKRRGNRPLTFQALANREPRLRDLLAEATAHHANREPVFCANAVWYGYPGFEPGFKSRLCRLVGHTAEQGGDLRTSEAYDVAYETIYQALPDCRGRCRCSVFLGI
jgi:hypothetical protein